MDFEKAHDSVSWSFLDYMLQRFCFDDMWKAWICVCVFLGSLFVLVNRCPTKEICIPKGLKTGDSLAALSFLLWQIILVYL